MDTRLAKRNYNIQQWKTIILSVYIMIYAHVEVFLHDLS